VIPIGVEVTRVETNRRSVVLISPHFETFEGLALRADYEVKGAAKTMVDGQRLVEFLSPDVVIVENELVGEQGWRGLPRLTEISPTSKLLLIVDNHWSPTSVGATGSFAVVSRYDPGAILNCLHDMDSAIEVHSAARNDTNRRRGGDRRVRQDWTKVGWERRKGPRRN
jgi:hypothetical protein